MPFGATFLDDAFGHPAIDRGVRFRLYAPSAKNVTLICDLRDGERRVATTRTADGFHEAVVAEARPGTRYAYDIDGVVAPDPAGRFAPDGVHGRSMVIDPLAFAWADESWQGRPWNEIVLYEMHVGTFTPEGTYLAASQKLDDLVALGVTAVELLPLAQSAGHRNWGYDGVLLYAPAHDYGSPDELKEFVSAAHARGLAVFLDVVYNHFGPEGNYLHGYAPEFYATDIHTPWGAAIDVEPDNRETVRAFFYENALYWLEEYRFDGLRFDAIDQIYDGPNRRFMHEVADLVRERIERPVYLVVENDKNEAALLESGFRAQWDDDAHHAAHVALTGQADGYYADYADDTVGAIGKALTQGFIYQGQPSAFRKGKVRGFPSAHLELGSFVTFLQNHDQIGNRPFGNRIATLAPPEALRAMLAVMLLAPTTPLLFMGEEWAASTPFLFFCDFEPELAAKVTEGRRSEFGGFAEFADPAARERIPDPSSLQAFTDSTLRWDERATEPHRTWLALYSDLLATRARAIAPRIVGLHGDQSAYERTGASGLRATYALAAGSQLVLDANLGADACAELAGRASAGETIYATHDAGTEAVPAWYARWSLH
jgi:1,4-alpha-glucan branching enzyme/maltooligosyltrehalose trehalohydrolase